VKSLGTKTLGRNIVPSVKCSSLELVTFKPLAQPQVLSLMPFRIVEVVQNVGLPHVKDEKQAPFTVRQKIRKQRRGSRRLT
jgi:hypothetical protein